jgi:HEAT repeat protein
MAPHVMNTLTATLITPTVLAATEDAGVFPGLKTYAYGQDRRILRAIEKQAQACLNDPEAREKLEAKLAGFLASDATFDAQQFVCRQLRFIGSAKSVPALAKLLTDPRLSGMARYALESIPDAAATHALRAGLKTTRGTLLIGVINSLGERRDREAVEDLKAWLAFKDDQISAAAVAALGKIGGRKATAALRLLSRNPDSRVFDALLMGADTLVAEGETARAIAIYRAVYRNPKLPELTRFAALRGWFKAAPDQAQPIIAKLADSSNHRTRLLALSLQEKPRTPGLAPKP